MQRVYLLLQQAAREIAATYPEPDFYLDFPRFIARSHRLYQRSPLVRRLSAFVREETRTNLGHGLGHAEKVALDAGAIAAVEGTRSNFPDQDIERLIGLAHCAGLLHDIRRRERHHAVAGAQAAREKLTADRSLNTEEIDCVAFAIRNHEAFKDFLPAATPIEEIISGSLYDADKFRWGPDNFTHTVWKMIEAAPPPLSHFIRLYPQALTYIAAIKITFRTPVGQTYGPRFIDTGLAIGRQLLERIESEFKGQL